MVTFWWSNSDSAVSSAFSDDEHCCVKRHVYLQRFVDVLIDLIKESPMKPVLRMTFLALSMAGGLVLAGGTAAASQAPKPNAPQTSQAAKPPSYGYQAPESTPANKPKPPTAPKAPTNVNPAAPKASAPKPAAPSAHPSAPGKPTAKPPVKSAPQKPTAKPGKGVPELDGRSTGAALALLLGGILVVVERRRARPAA
jgi:hypothetical protein